MGGFVEDRRARLVARHLLDGSAPSPEDAAHSVVVLHATDPATVYLSVLARGADLTVGDVSRALYDDRTLVRMMGMRRTLFVVPAELASVVHAAAALDVAATIRKRLVIDLARLPTEPPLPDDLTTVAAWLSDVETAVAAYVQRRGAATGAEIGDAEPRLRTAILPSTEKSYDVRRTITTRVLTLMAAEGRLLRGRPEGPWTSRRHTWEPVDVRWPTGLRAMDPRAARAVLVERYLGRFGPATEADVAWWTGWPLRRTREALAALPTVGVEGGLVLADDVDPTPPAAPAATLLPALDPTPMGWRDRDWFLPPEPGPLYDRSGNVGPTVWWCGEVVGGWAVRGDGSVVTRLLVDRGAEAERAVAAAAAGLHGRLAGTVVVPAFRTPLERELSEA